MYSTHWQRVRCKRGHISIWKRVDKKVSIGRTHTHTHLYKRMMIKISLKKLNFWNFHFNWNFDWGDLRSMQFGRCFFNLIESKLQKTDMEMTRLFDGRQMFGRFRKINWLTMPSDYEFDWFVTRNHIHMGSVVWKSIIKNGTNNTTNDIFTIQSIVFRWFATLFFRAKITTTSEIILTLKIHATFFSWHIRIQIVDQNRFMVSVDRSICANFQSDTIERVIGIGSTWMIEYGSFQVKTFEERKGWWK